MTIAGSLANALSGLNAQARAAELVSSNVANATTEGYGRRELDLQPRYMGDGTSSGVNVVGVRREIDAAILQDRRLADSAVGYDRIISRYHADLERVLGTPDQPGSLSGRIAAFEATLIEAGSRPDNEARLAASVNAATAITEHLNNASRMVQASRMEADAAIASQVRQLNDGLQRVQNLNYQIKESIARGQDPSPLMDIRQKEVDGIAAIVPLRQVERESAMVALYTTGGAILLDGRAAEIGFSPVGVIVPEMTLASGALSGLTINGEPVRVSGDRSPIRGGALAALFEQRDELAPRAQAQLDAVARDLIERFQEIGLDPTLAPGAPGLFTDDAGPFDPADEVGLAGRITVNAAVRPEVGGALWRLRDGLGAALPGAAGNATLINDLHAALLQSRVPASGAITGVARSASGLVGDLLSRVSSDLLAAEGRASHSSAMQDSLTFMELQSGVDTDHELQKLLVIERAYAANARVIATVGAMLDAVMEI